MTETLTGPGAPSTVIAADLGGTFTKFALVEADGTSHEPDQLPTPTTLGSMGLVEWLAGELARRGRAAGVSRFGVAVPGIIDEHRGVVVTAANLNWRNLPLAELLEQLSGLNGTLTHDVRAGGRAEWFCGAGVGAQDLLFIPIGTGVAAAVVIDGTLVTASGYAGEIGHMPVPAAEHLECACGQRGCLERIISGPGLRRHYERVAGIETADAPSAEVIAERARSGDRLALRVIADAGIALGQALRIAVTLFGTERVVIGGGVSGMFDLLEPVVTDHLSSTMSFQRMPQLVPAALGAQAGVVGAGLTSWSRAVS